MGWTPLPTPSTSCGFHPYAELLRNASLGGKSNGKRCPRQNACPRLTGEGQPIGGWGWGGWSVSWAKCSSLGLVGCQHLASPYKTSWAKKTAASNMGSWGQILAFQLLQLRPHSKSSPISPLWTSPLPLRTPDPIGKRQLLPPQKASILLSSLLS